ncbi:MAG: HPr family phosphocarrier protein [Nitrospinae bacterium]|nr:HPr family phosphocarrier protein [Nitrospinota bacterium]
MEYKIKSSVAIKEISETEFAPMVTEAAKDFFRMSNYFRLTGLDGLPKRSFSEYAQICNVLESFLDDHGARDNTHWAFFAELVASIRNLGIAAYIMRHVLDRQMDYHCGETQMALYDFVREGFQTLDFLKSSIVNLGNSAEEEAKRLSVQVDNHVFECRQESKEIYYVLPKNMNESIVENKEERIVELVHKVRKVAKIMDEERIKKESDPEKLYSMIPLKIDEKKARKLKNTIHGVQSDYDTYVKNTQVEKKNADLKLLRGFISIPLHLLEMVRWLSHFYERHEDAIRQSEETAKIARIVDKMTVLDRIVNFGYFFSDQYMRQARKVAEKILNLYVKPVRYELPVPSKGFHARPSTYISLIVNEHGTDVFLIVGDQKYNAKSVMNLMMAAGIIYDMGLKTVIFEGDQRVLDDIRILAENNYCEDQEIPRELNYLRILRNVGTPIV